MYFINLWIILSVFSWINQEPRVQRLDQQHRMQAHQQDQKVAPFHLYLLATHHRINDYKIHTDRQPINMADRSIHMPMFAQTAYHLQHLIQPAENRKFLA